MRDFKEGDVVQLKIGSPDMVVRLCAFSETMWVCEVVWMNNADELQSATLPEVCLVAVVEEPKVRPFSVGDRVFNITRKKFGWVRSIGCTTSTLQVTEEGYRLCETWQISQTEHAN